MNNVKKRLPLAILISVIGVGIYVLIYLYQKDRTDEILQEQITYLELSYKQGLDRFNVIGNNIYLSMQNDSKFIDILADTNKTNLKDTHQKLYEHLEEEFAKLKLSGIMGIQVLSPENISILRVHKPGKYGDDLTTIRPMIAAVNKEKIHMHGFEEGKSSHAFREVFPLYKEGDYIGVLEVLFSSTKLQDYTMRASNIHTHFIVNKNVFKTNEWKSRILEPYEQSIEHEDFLFSMNDHINHTRLDESQNLVIAPLRKQILQGIKSEKVFALYKTVSNTAKVVVFYPVKRFKDGKAVAYIVSYTDSDKIYNLVSNIYIINIVVFIGIFIIFFIVSKLILQKETIMNELKYDALTYVYNRKYFMNYSEKIYKEFGNSQEKFSIVMADIDHFKHVNDTYGHQHGDVVLKEFSTILKDSLRSMDIVARYGGEEFIIFLHTNETNSYKIIEDIRKKIENSDFGEKPINLTASFGVAQYKDDISFEEIIKRADNALYVAKESGRNQVQIG